MRNRKLGRVLAGLSAFTIMSICLIAALVLILMPDGSGVVKTAYACPTPTPTQTPPGCSCESDNGTTLTLELKVECTTSTLYIPVAPANSDNLTRTLQSMYNMEDLDIIYSILPEDQCWMLNSDWINWTFTPKIDPSQAGIYYETISVDDRPATFTCPHLNTKSYYDDPETHTVAKVGVVEIDKIQIMRVDNQWEDISEPLCVPVGFGAYFRAIKNPAPAQWPNGKPTWGGSCGATGIGEQKYISFGEASTSPTDFKTITAECGNIKTVNVIVFEMTDFEYKRTNENDTFYKSDGGGVGGKVLFNASFDYRVKINPDVSVSEMVWEAWDVDFWEEELSSSTGIPATYTFSTELGKGSAEFLFYFDKNKNSEWNTNEPYAIKEFEVVEMRNRPITIKRASTTSGPNDSAADGIISDANSRIQIRNTPEDYRALCEFTRSGSVVTYTVDADHPGDILTEDDWTKVKALGAGVAVVKSITWNNNPNVCGLGTIGAWNECAVEEATGGGCWVHELGHNAGLDHNSSNNANVMYPSLGANNLLNESEASHYE